MTTRTKSDLTESLTKCRRHGREAIEQVEHLQPELHDILEELRHLTEQDEATGNRSDEEAVLSKDVQAMLDSELNDLQGALDELAEKHRTELADTFETLREHADEVTIVLFGRTLAGKSTTMEALTEGDGEAIGDGHQHYTTEIHSYHWPDEDSQLRIVDTPGVEGYEGDEMAGIAESFIDQADHIFFLFYGDKESSGELEYFANLRSMGKGITALLNMREKNLDLLTDMPEYVFDEDDIDGHRRRIEGYLRENHGIEDPEIIPYHARAAWRATQTKGKTAETLRQVSRIGRIESRIEQFVRNEAVGARIRNPRQAMRSYIATVKEEVREFAGRFRNLHNEVNDQRDQLHDSVGDLKGRAGNRLSEMKARFEDAQSTVPGVVDRVIESSDDGRSGPLG